MRSMQVILLAFGCIVLSLSLQLDAACICNEKGIDYCRGCSEGRIVRPKPKYYDNDDLELPPIGDTCWCHKQSIQPAVLPKTPCTKLKPSRKPTDYYDNLPHAPYVTSHVNYIGAGDVEGKLPADPISISMAYQAGKAIAVPEAKLSYGFQQKPIDGLKKVYFSAVPEEDLFLLKKDVITLKKPSYPKEEEPIEVEEEEANPADAYDERPYLTYQQLGYVAEQLKNPKFVPVPYTGSVVKEYARVPDKVTVDYGYRPGRIAPHCLRGCYTSS